MINITGKVITLSGSVVGNMCSFDDFTFENLITWVYRNCPGNILIKIENNEVSALYEDRIEIYYLTETADKRRGKPKN